MAVKTGSVPAKAAAKATAKSPAKPAAKPRDVMAFSFADTIAGYVKRMKSRPSFKVLYEREGLTEWA